MVLSLEIPLDPSPGGRAGGISGWGEEGKVYEHAAYGTGKRIRR